MRKLEILNEIKKLFGQDKQEGKKNKLFQNIVIMGMIGFLLLFAGNLFDHSNNTNNQTEQLSQEIIEQRDSDYNLTINNYEEELARQLENIISLIDGVGTTQVQLKTSHSIIYEYEYNIREDNKITNERDQNEGERRIEENQIERDLVVIRNSDGSEEPVVRMKKKPEITGVIVIAEGAENSKIKYDIYHAISNFLDLALYKISVLPHERR